MTIRNAADCEHGWHSVLTCPFCLRNQKERMTDQIHINNLHELLDYQRSTIKGLRGQVADLDEQVAFLSKKLDELEGN